jgi:hypothetical protein
MKTSLFIEIVSGLHKNAPDASPEDLANILIKVIEKDILPIAIKNMNLPSPPSPLEIKREQLYLKRAPKRSRNLPTLKEKEKLIREFEDIKHYLNGRDADNPSFVPDFSVTDFDTPKIPFDLTFKSSIQVPSPKTDGLSRESILEELTVSPYIKPAKEKKEKGNEVTKFIIANEIQNRIVSDSLFKDVFRVIEIAIKDFITTCPFEMDFTAYFREDIEIPEWKKVVLSVNAFDLEYEQKMSLWDTIDSYVRNAIHELMETMEPSERKKIEDINKKLFIRMELI